MLLLPLKRLWAEEDGQDLIEYALLVVLVALASMASVTHFATVVSTYMQNAGNKIAQN